MKPPIKIVTLLVLYELTILVLSEADKGNEFFTAASDMEILLKVEKKLADKFLKYFEAEETRLNELERILTHVEKDLPPRTSEFENEKWISHVTNAHGSLDRFTKFWNNFDNYTKTRTTKDNLLSLFADLVKLKPAYPTNEDLLGALAALTRLQQTYAISPSNFVDGIRQPSHKLTLEEIFEIGYLCLQTHDYIHGHAWLKEALYRFPVDAKSVGFVEKAMLLEHLAWCEYYLGKLEDAIKHTRAILKFDPTNNNALINIELYEREFELSKSDPTIRKNFTQPKHHWENHHNKLCQGREKMAQKDINRLFCKYVAPKAHYILKPFKMEVLHHDPYIELYYELITDDEAKHIIKFAKPLLRRAFVHDMVTGDLIYADYRVSKNTWIAEDMDVIAAKIIRRVGDVTGLNMRYAEHLQVANYGIAGQYEPHFDHSTGTRPKHFDRWGGNRIATMLLYLSDVDWGGRTVFTNTAPGVGTDPIKGAGVFWYNLLRNGKSNPKTQHAGCPVVLGQKWVANLWIHEHGQEFNRPCTLNPNE